MAHDAYTQLKGHFVEFLIRDVYLPDPSTILSELDKERTLTGKVVDLSDDARDEKAAFLVVDVKGLDEPCIVAAGLAKPTNDPEPEES